MSLSAGTRLGPYEIVAPIGAGGMGEVYRAADARLNRTVAIKVLPAALAHHHDRRQRFEREARAVSSLAHAHICALYDVGRENGTEFLAMEYVEGETLEKRLGAGPLRVDQALAYAIEIADALDHAHRLGIVHRDLKPSNIMVTKSGMKLLDFGLAKMSAADPIFESASSFGKPIGPETLTDNHTILGTLHYMAPEQLEGRSADARADIFAFGAVIYEMVTGRKAFEGTSQASVIAAVLRAELPPLTPIQPGMPAALDRAIRKCLAKDPDDRWQTARDLASELMWIRETGSQAIHQPPVGRPRSRPRFAWIAAGALLVIATLTTLAVVLISSRQQRQQPATPIQFTVSAPEGATFVECNQCMAVSPDGRHLAFVASSPKEGELLWLRSLDSATARPLAGTEGARGPFWSPDSQAVGFHAQGKIKKIDVSGRNLQTLGESPGTIGNQQGATWNREGVVLFASIGAGLTRVSIAGGTPIAVTTLDPQRAERAHSWPQFLPDGRHFLYRVSSRREEYTAIFLGSLDSRDRTLLVNANANPVYAGPGYLVYGVNGTLLAQSLDLSTFRLSGTPVVLAQQIMFNTSSGRSAFSASDTVLAYRQTGNTELRWFDRGGRELDVVGPPGSYLDPSLSPDGQQLAVARVDADVGTSHIWLFDVARGSGAPLTSGRSWDRSPIWSPDGRLVGFASKRTASFEMYQKPSDAAGGDEQPMGHLGFPASWSPDGSFMVFYQAEGPGTLGALPSHENQRSTELPKEFVGQQAQLSPDGRWIAYVSNETGQSEVYVRPFSSVEPKRRISAGGGVEPKWRRDGKEIFYLALDRRLMAVDVRGNGTFTAGAPSPLFVTRAQASTAFIVGRNEYDVTADGRRFLFNVPVEGASSPLTVVVNWAAALPR